MRPFWLLLRLAPLFIIHSAANAQTPPITPDVRSALSSNNENVAPKPDTSGQSAKPSPKFRVPDGFGGLKEVPDSPASDQTGSTTIPTPLLVEPDDDGNSERR
jgi:hypothetical protein